jgi:signal peptidase I
MVPAAGVGRVLRWLTGPWSSANGLSWLRLLIVFVVLRWGFLTVYSIPSASMEPVLNGDASWFTRDRVAINKLAYGPRYPFTTQRIFRGGVPKRWDIVVFNSPQPTDEGDVLIKRVVGLPGEIVRVLPNGLFVNGKRILEPAHLAGMLNYTPGLEATHDEVNRLALMWAKRGMIPADIVRDTSPARAQLQKDLEKLSDKVQETNVTGIHPLVAADLVREVAPEGLALIRKWREDYLRRVGMSRYGVSTSLEMTLVPQDHYFVLGDNGPESIDSRIFGWVPHENLVGRAFAIVTPFGRARDLSGFLDEPRGRLIFFGSIALALAWELLPGFLCFSWTLRGAIPALRLKRRDRVVVNRIVYGLRVPFTNHRVLWWRSPKPGEVLCFLMSPSGNGFDLYFGDVLSVDSTGGLQVIVRGPGGTEPYSYRLSRRDIVGRVRVVWAPRNRRGRVRVESTGDNRLH